MRRCGRSRTDDELEQRNHYTPRPSSLHRRSSNCTPIADLDRTLLCKAARTSSIEGTTVSQDSLGLRLRAERERRRITLESIAANTKIGITLLRGLERDDVSRWPGGIFRRSFVRAYAEAIGLDAESVVSDFVQRFPDPDHIAIPSVVPPPPAVAPVSVAAATPPTEHKLRLTMANSWSPFVAGPVLERARERGAAAALDVGLMLALALIIFMIVGEFWAPLGITMLCYYVVSIMSLGNTPGVCLFAPQPEDHEATLHRFSEDSSSFAGLHPMVLGEYPLHSEDARQLEPPDD